MKVFKGAGESGKSTIAKQMKILHKEGFTLEERNSYKSVIYSNVVSAMRSICEAAYDLNITIENKVSNLTKNQVIDNTPILMFLRLFQGISRSVTFWNRRIHSG